MTNSSEEPEVGISDEQLPDDLQPTEENPLAQPLPDDVDVDDLPEGKIAEEMEEPPDEGEDEADS